MRVRDLLANLAGVGVGNYFAKILVLGLVTPDDVDILLLLRLIIKSGEVYFFGTASIVLQPFFMK